MTTHFPTAFFGKLDGKSFRVSRASTLRTTSLTTPPPSDDDFFSSCGKEDHLLPLRTDAEIEQFVPHEGWPGQG